ncbi:MAG: DUF362 domain-containing protein [Deltaproteobacteria bacterium]|nr:DUF362 domain-containing protein [Deltaproteobacteria bacterium]MBW1912567.1 DUF362 domain-containing protein [Deltaproteobacteria bacterium]
MKKYRYMDRRRFLKLMAIVSAGATLPWRIAHGALDKLNKSLEIQVALTSVKKGSDDPVLIEAVKDAARAATDFSWLSRGDSVLIKPALNSGNPYPATTSPEAIRAMVQLLREKGVNRVIVSDMSGVEHVKLTQEKLKGSSRELMKKSGMAKAAIGAGAELFFPEEGGWGAFFEDDPVDSTYWKKGIMMPNILKEVDHIVLMPRCGRHVLLGSSLGMKNAVGYWRTDSRLEYHKYASSIQEKTADANTVKSLRDKLRLVLTTGTKILTTYGPDKGFVAEPETGLVIASESIVAHDMVSLAWLLQNRLAMSEEEKKKSRDPYKRQIVVSSVNRIVVKLLGGFGEAWNAEKLVRNDIDSIWEDRVLNRAYEVFGGIPKVNLVDVEDSVPKEMAKKLSVMVSKSNQKRYKRQGDNLK